MKLIHYVKISNFKCFGAHQEIALDHPTVLVGPNNCGKTTALQAIALWSRAVKIWHETKGTSPPKTRTATSLNRLEILSVPIERTRFFWHNTIVRRGKKYIRIEITVGIKHGDGVQPVTMLFRNFGEDLIYCTPDAATLEDPCAIGAGARMNVAVLYPRSGLEAEEPILQPGRSEVLVGQGQTAQVLRNLCLMVHENSSDDWKTIAAWIKRLFRIDLGVPRATPRGSIYLGYSQPGVKEELSIAQAGRGMLQMLLLLAHLYANPRSILIIDEPDAHLEILRQRQVYVLLTHVARANDSQVILVTHSEVIVNEAADHNVTLLLDGVADDIAVKSGLGHALRHFGAEHYLRAKQCGYVLYGEGRTDLDILHSLALRLNHPATLAWDAQINAYFVQDNYPVQDADSEIERVEGGFGLNHRQHFSIFRELMPSLSGLAILDSNGSSRSDSAEGGLQVTHWKRYEIENYFITPNVLRQFAFQEYSDEQLSEQQLCEEIDGVLDALILQRAFEGSSKDFETWRGSNAGLRRLVWTRTTERIKLSNFAETFFRELAGRLDRPMLLRKRDLYRLVDLVAPDSIAEEVSQKLDQVQSLFEGANP